MALGLDREHAGRPGEDVVHVAVAQADVVHDVPAWDL